MDDFFIKFTALNDNIFYLRASSIIGIKKCTEGTSIMTLRSVDYVKESVEEVFKMLGIDVRYSDRYLKAF